VLLDQPAPGDVAGVLWTHLGRELHAHGRADAVGCDEQVAFLLRAVVERRRHAVRTALDARDATPEVIPLGRKDILQQPVDASPRRHHLRQVAGPRDAAVARERDPAPDPHADRLVERRAGARERAHELGMGGEPGAAAGERFARLLVHVDPPARPQEQVGGEQPAERAADHQRAFAHRLPLGFIG
jgi:hypothetical protein